MSDGTAAGSDVSDIDNSDDDEHAGGGTDSNEEEPIFEDLVFP